MNEEVKEHVPVMHLRAFCVQREQLQNLCNQLCGVAIVDEERSEGGSVLSNSHKANQSKPSLAEPAKNESKFLRVYDEDEVRSVSGQIGRLNDEREPLIIRKDSQRFRSAKI